VEGGKKGGFWMRLGERISDGVVEVVLDCRGLWRPVMKA
jgi:hypothetical protein